LAKVVSILQIKGYSILAHEKAPFWPIWSI
jgi:hypothetical protein